MKQHATPGRSSWFFLLLVCLLRARPGLAQAPAWQQVVEAGGKSANVWASATDAAGNVYLTGTFRTTASFGSTTLTSAGLGDVFVAKWSRSAGAFAWAQQLGGPGEDYAYALAASGTRVYVGGSFTGTVVAGGSTLLSAGDEDGLVVRLTDAGTTASVDWAQQLGGAAADRVTALAASGSGLYVGGELNSPTSLFGPLSVGNASNFSAGTTADGFVAHLTDMGPNGVFTWVRGVGGTGADRVTGLAAGGGGCYVVGGFSNTVSFGGTSLSGGGLTAFYGRLLDSGSSGDFAWALASGGIVIPNAVAATENGVYVAGRFVFSGTWGSTSYAASPGGGYDVFVAKLTDAGTSGSFAWALRGGGPLSDYASALAVRGNQVYVAGGFGATATFGSLSATSSSLSDDWFVAKVLDQGSTAAYAWVQQAGGPAYEQATALALGQGGTIYVGGNAGPGAGFGPLAAAGGGTLGILADPALAAREARTLPGLALYPNPARGTATVRVPAGAGPATLYLLDALGRLLRRETAAAGQEHPLSLAGLAPGVYAVRVQAGEQAAVQKLLVE